ncbi:hypothetical protein HanLR1_Chr05g0193811 [Helianthus annuus]|nr:hypothetical protein HanLR1_Chr05g0193811 [Helianthus annuus]
MNTPEEQMKDLGFFGIFTHTFKAIFSRKKLFTQITLTLILPLTLIFLAHYQISNRFFSRLESSYIIAYDTRYRSITLTDWLHYWLFKIIYFTFLLIFSLLSTAAVVFTVASAYADRDVTFRRLIKIVPNIWKKLFITFVFIYFTLFIYNVLTGVVLFIFRSVFGYTVFGSVSMLIILLVYVLGFLYLSVVWQLASVVTVLENVNGYRSMQKGKQLANGKKAVGMGIAFVLYGLLLGVLIGVLCGVLFMELFLVFIVAQTVLYLVCKSYHREVVDKVCLSTFLSGYVGETVVYPKPGEEIQLGRAQAQPQTPAQMV